MALDREIINANGTQVEAFRNNDIDADFISITDIAKYKNQDNPNDLIRNWMRSRNTIEYLGLWEQMKNNNFNTDNYQELLNESGSNTFVLSPAKWIKETNAIGIISKSGRYGGTYAQSDIAFEFASWVSPEFRLYLISDYQQLKQSESSHLNLDWNVNRTLSKINYQIHTDAIKEKLIPSTVSKKQAGYKYASEADRLNMALFGMTAKQWRSSGKRGNLRESATLEQLTVLANLESMNAELIKNNVSEFERTMRLNNMAKDQMATLLKNSTSMKQLKNLTAHNSPKKLN
ncbi:MULTISPECIES: KilA-N domain-containing protein [Lactiplantibacillus]|uniref:KilA-N domain-containing protein n=1 Tax=Lactiplantibacillus TaxID=2767842 RepID=UPI0001E58FEA|nr:MULTISPECIES: KilA-N domain-containing protein [Lactiplantibacillus]ADN97942.1 KilA domain protein [Lactiplantibacillus plantarum ST-III]AMX09747.1 DNA-binding protein [Lactiplantibacillus plantarum]ATL78121.1 DNA-binding protein [Lactiplantibacillus plantarum]MBO2726713.1 KilA-N domain-containing protein [Lactiplantibacillus plantarum]MDB7779341.1 KilA-N domain-containing protein [Lactiplantibacillus plantarum]